MWLLGEWEGRERSGALPVMPDLSVSRRFQGTGDFFYYDGQRPIDIGREITSNNSLPRPSLPAAGRLHRNPGGLRDPTPKIFIRQITLCGRRRRLLDPPVHMQS
ncbi:hypothetical protein AGR6A_Cc60494 [Agrobacterium sp. NCPPB 925]|nr:hypothetical protein AGR6A_Cc60494 [Agrobacterium sp. NCPPB 925]